MSSATIIGTAVIDIQTVSDLINCGSNIDDSGYALELTLNPSSSYQNKNKKPLKTPVNLHENVISAGKIKIMFDFHEDRKISSKSKIPNAAYESMTMTVNELTKGEK